MQLPATIEIKSMRVLTTKQIAEAYGASKDKIIYNFNYNKNRYILGKHYIEVKGEELRRLKTTCENQMSLKYTKSLYLWTEKGALLHAKSLNTDKAWEVYDYLVDFYFRAKEERKVPVTVAGKQGRPNMMTVVDVPENPEVLKAIQKIKDDLTCMDVLLDNCKKYLSEDAYKERRNAAEGIVHVILSDFNSLLCLKPKLIQKVY
nr:MAG TPA: hypothetical protein [Caudoviricetes sp.]